ncbi:unnamed protein product, partial [Mesorhabditis spiculigera]
MLIHFIIADHHSRAELMVLWFTELYTQYLGYSFCGADKSDKQAAKEAALGKYNMIVDKFLRKLPAPTEWTDKLYSIAVQTYLELIPQDPALIHYLASVYAVGNNLLKKAILQKIELPIANHTDTSEIVNLINNCPQKAETLVARIVHVLSVNSKDSLAT